LPSTEAPVYEIAVLRPMSQQIGKLGAIPVSCFDESYLALEKSSFAMVMAVIALGQPE
jgi:hypothetical protein